MDVLILVALYPLKELVRKPETRPGLVSELLLHYDERLQVCERCSNSCLKMNS